MLDLPCFAIPRQPLVLARPKKRFLWKNILNTPKPLRQLMCRVHQPMCRAYQAHQLKLLLEEEAAEAAVALAEEVEQAHHLLAALTPARPTIQISLALMVPAAKVGQGLMCAAEC